MRKFILKLGSYLGRVIFALLMTCVGLLGVNLLSATWPTKVTLCQLAQNPSLYKGQIIRVEADGSGILGGFTIEDDACEEPDAWATVNWDDHNAPSAAADAIFAETESIKYARVAITGRFDPNAFLGCFGPKAAIEATNIELLSEVKMQPRLKAPEGESLPDDSEPVLEKNKSKSSGFRIVKVH